MRSGWRSAAGPVFPDGYYVPYMGRPSRIVHAVYRGLTTTAERSLGHPTSQRLAGQLSDTKYQWVLTTCASLMDLYTAATHLLSPQRAGDADCASPAVEQMQLPLKPRYDVCCAVVETPNSNGAVCPSQHPFAGRISDCK